MKELMLLLGRLCFLVSSLTFSCRRAHTFDRLLGIDRKVCYKRLKYAVVTLDAAGCTYFWSLQPILMRSCICLTQDRTCQIAMQISSSFLVSLGKYIVQESYENGDYHEAALPLRNIYFFFYRDSPRIMKIEHSAQHQPCHVRLYDF